MVNTVFIQETTIWYHKIPIYDGIISELWIGENGILRRKEGAADKYKNQVFNCKLCGWAYSNKYASKAKRHRQWEVSSVLGLWKLEPAKIRSAEACESMSGFSFNPFGLILGDFVSKVLRWLFYILLISCINTVFTIVNYLK